MKIKVLWYGTRGTQRELRTTEIAHFNIAKFFFYLIKHIFLMIVSFQRVILTIIKNTCLILFYQLFLAILLYCVLYMDEAPPYEAQPKVIINITAGRLFSTENIIAFVVILILLDN